jgi:hypothetical protein
MDRCQSTMKSIPDNLRPEPWLKMWHMFDIEGIMHKEFVPPGEAVNGKFYCDVLRWLRENIRRTLPDKWHNNAWALHHDIAPPHTSLLVWQFMASTKTTVVPHSPYSLNLATCDFFPVPEDEIEARRVTFWQQWRDPDWITGHNEDADAKWLPAVLPIMRIPLGLLC